MNDEITILQEQVKYYSENKTKVHIDLKSGRFLNGFILSFDKIKFTFKDKVIADEITLFYSAIKNLEPYIDGGNY